MSWWWNNGIVGKYLKEKTVAVSALYDPLCLKASEDVENIILLAVVLSSKVGIRELESYIEVDEDVGWFWVAENNVSWNGGMSSQQNYGLFLQNRNKLFFSILSSSIKFLCMW